MRYARRYRNRMVVVSTSDGDMLKGTLTHANVDCVELVEAVFVRPGDGSDIPIGGAVLVPVIDIRTLQVV